MRSELYSFLWLGPYWHEPPSTKRTKEGNKKKKSHQFVTFQCFKKKFLGYRNVILSKTVFKNWIYGREDCAEWASSKAAAVRVKLKRLACLLPHLAPRPSCSSSCSPRAGLFISVSSLHSFLSHSCICVFLYPIPTPHTPSGPLPIAVLFLSFHFFLSLMLSTVQKIIK